MSQEHVHPIEIEEIVEVKEEVILPVAVVIERGYYASCWYFGIAIFNIIYTSSVYYTFYKDSKLSLEDKYWFKLAWKVNIYLGYATWAPIIIMWFCIYFLRVPLLNSLFVLCAKVGLAGPYGLYWADLLLFCLSIILDGNNATSFPTMTGTVLNTLGVGIVLGLTSWIQFTKFWDIVEWEKRLNFGTRGDYEDEDIED